MAVNKATTVDNKKIIEGPATQYDSNKFGIYAIHMQEIIKTVGKNEKPNKKNAEMVVTNKIARPVLSTDLTQGMTITAKLGGKSSISRGMEH